MIKMSEILMLDKLTYSDTIPKKHQDKMDGDSGIFKNMDISQFMSSPPSKNSSNQTLKEMVSLDNIQMDLKLIKKADSIHKIFGEYLESVGEKYPRKKVEALIQDSKPIIYKLKYHYNRPRPAQVAKAYALKFYNEPLETAKTPSYPSGHSTQGILIGKYLAAMFPKYANELMGIGDTISKSRLAANIHFPSDSLFGERIGVALYLYMRNTASLGMEKL